MTEMLVNPETQPTELKAVLEDWVENPPPHLNAALAERGVDVESLENYARSGITTEEAEMLRRVLIQGATTGEADDAALLARLTPLLDPRERAWDRVMRAKNTGEILTATVTEATKGGVVVDLGVRGFVPSSQIGLSVPRNLTQYVGRPLRLRVLEVDRRRQTVILSNRQVEEEERARKRRTAIERLEEGQERTGTVRRITDIGAFVDVGGVDGLLHVSEISWKRVEHPSEVLKVGEKVQVKILRVDPEAGRVSLSMRRLIVDPWEEARKKYTTGSTLTVKIGRIIPQGAIIDLDDGLEAFLPVSEMANRRIASPEEVVQVGQEVEAVVIELHPRDRRIVLSLRKLEQRRERQTLETVQRKAQVRGNSERTTLGDLFGHLFEEFGQPEEPAQKPAPRPAAEPPAEEQAADGAATEALAPALSNSTDHVATEPAGGHEAGEEAADGVLAREGSVSHVEAPIRESLAMEDTEEEGDPAGDAAAVISGETAAVGAAAAAHNRGHGGEDEDSAD